MSDEEETVAQVEPKETQKKSLKRKVLKEEMATATTSSNLSKPFYDNISEIRNKMKRGEKFAKLRKEKKKVSIIILSFYKLNGSFILGCLLHTDKILKLYTVENCITLKLENFRSVYSRRLKNLVPHNF